MNIPLPVLICAGIIGSGLGENVEPDGLQEKRDIKKISEKILIFFSIDSITLINFNVTNFYLILIKYNTLKNEV